jgi:hypothetical protein
VCRTIYVSFMYFLSIIKKLYKLWRVRWQKTPYIWKFPRPRKQMDRPFSTTSTSCFASTDILFPCIPLQRVNSHAASGKRCKGEAACTVCSQQVDSQSVLRMREETRASRTVIRFNALLEQRQTSINLLTEGLWIHTQASGTGPQLLGGRRQPGTVNLSLD